MIWCRVGKMNRWLLALLIPPLLVAILTVKSLCTLTIIAGGSSLVQILIAGHDGCCKIVGILKRGFLVTYYGSSFVDFLGGFPPYPFLFDMQSFLRCGPFYHICDK